MLRKIKIKKTKELPFNEEASILGGATCPISCGCTNCGTAINSKNTHAGSMNKSKLAEEPVF